MEPELLKPTDDADDDGGAPRPWYALAVIVAALAIAAGGIVAVRPYVIHRLEVRNSYRQLKESRNGDVVRWLIRNGENPDATLLEMLYGEPSLTPSNIFGWEAAEVLAEYLPLRSDLQQPLRPYFAANSAYGAMKVGRGFYRADPTNFDAYLQVLLKGISGNSSFERERALIYLRELGPVAHDAIPHLQSLREEHPGFAPEIDRTLLAIEGPMSEAN